MKHATKDMWHTLSKKTLLEKLQTDSKHGLSEQEAAMRLQHYGANQLPPEKTDTLLAIFIGQFRSPLILILAIACAILFAIAETSDAIVILFVLFFNASIGTIQEGRAQRSLAALRKLVSADAIVLRDGKEIILSDSMVVPGDIVIIEEGAKIPVDGRVIESYGLRVDESALTGESGPIDKEDSVLKNEKLTSSDQRNMVFKGTVVLSGNAVLVAVETGVRTEIGKISTTIAKIDTEIPLHAEIRNFSRFVSIAVVVLGISLFSLGIALGNTIQEMFGVTVSVAVSVIPEGLPVVMTAVLATGVWRMAKRNALVKKLQAVEALGQANVIAVDKTGTITRNEMVVRQICMTTAQYQVDGNGYAPIGAVYKGGSTVSPSEEKDLIFLNTLAILSSNARVAQVEHGDGWRITGDPTEAAMVVFSNKLKIPKEQIEQEYPRISEIPFSSQTKYHAVFAHNRGEGIITVAGAAERLLPLCKKYYDNGKEKNLTAHIRTSLEKTLLEASQKGFRVIGITFKGVVSDHVLAGNDITDLVFAGFYCIEDSIRPEARDAVLRARGAGIRIVMITGDHKLTAQAIATEAGIYQEGDTVLTAEDLESFSPSQLSNALEKTTVFARVTPEHKMAIIQGYKARGDIVAMTGDGVNDAPALVAADLGVSMGKIGTEVAREASDIVLLDDNLSSIVAAIEEGRNIYIAIKRVILYLLSTNAGEVLTIIAALLLGFPLPLVAAQIIWLNLVTDSFLDITLSLEPKQSGLLSSTFRRGKGLFDRLMKQRTILMATTMMVGTLYVYTSYFQTDALKGQTMAFTTLALFQWFNAINCRSRDRSILRMNPFSNPYLIGAFCIVFVLQLLAIYHPLLQSVLRTTSLSLDEWMFALGVASSIIIIEEIRKSFYRSKTPLWNHSST